MLLHFPALTLKPCRLQIEGNFDFFSILYLIVFYNKMIYKTSYEVVYIRI